ncbi:MULTISPECIES: C4-type zinc ribbon domain-containing protein [unclassified Streptomyces]|uniref:zinc ribbon domain-containing protein n=1 Tax=unclassified Streptomyces TaxID=2593676 RepID=UPI0019D30147|nr:MULTISPECIES: C4-type zinc ribbon domain-containing protein [unclassified Streptomyces]WSG55741.1 C4-type zinc ribbon domain-containing protein [Streptomyces sp. NBC_01732]WSX06878.1 C4-type zinc ribbon domain-containing protein [Streptomyces sp. NBC_00987]MCX4396959.1 C4-type zinc ribbon domain-containing protein [Streptomyces sp. NBC_01767]MCX5100420.1 C4-type zinc ribbon domain-containing protein [Streptomyces sp. NBC_00439]MCX5159889.1 C4-type zinc ribbon domain-containing protein [Stre
MNAAPADQIRLLDVQALDVRLSQLAHRRKSLPEHAEIESLTNDLAQLRDLLVASQTEESDTAREQTKAEQDVDQVRQRAARDQQRLDSGAVTSPKDLESLQREITSLAKRQGDLEDVVLEVMERRESAQERVTELSDRVSAVQAKADDATARRDAATKELDEQAATVTKEREVVAGSVPADLMKLYDRLRAQQGGVGAARLYQRRCEGCRLELNITEVNDVKAASPDTVLRCENCQRILVRTSESGL